MQKLTVWFSGRVQGVGFRAAVARLSRGFDVTGRVRNLDDGRVELEAEGSAEELRRFRDQIALEMKRHVSGQVEQWSSGGSGWATFEVDY